MNRSVLLTTALSTGLSVLGFAGPAWAVYNQQMILTGGGATSIPGNRISFTTSSGETIPVTDDGDDDDGIFMLVFPGQGAQSGTLVITNPDGTTTSIMVPAGRPGQDISINVPGRTAILVPSGGKPMISRDGYDDAPKTYIRIGGGFASLDVPGVGAGTLIGADGESFVGESDSRLSGLSGSATIGFNTDLFSGMNIEMTFGYGEADGETSGSVASGTDNVGIVYHDFSPSDSTGVFIGASGLDVTNQVDVEYKKFRLQGGWNMPQGNGASIQPYISLEYMKIDQDHWSLVTTPSFADITADSTQEVDQKNWSLGVGAMYTKQLESGLTFGFGGGVNAIYRDANLWSQQVNVCGVCGAGNNFTAEINDDESDITFGGNLKANVGFQISDGVAIGLYGQYVYLDKVAKVFNPSTGDDLFVDNNPTHLESASSSNWLGGAFLSIGF